MKPFYRNFLTLLFCTGFITGCNQSTQVIKGQSETPLSEEFAQQESVKPVDFNNIIPLPAEYKQTKGNFDLGKIDQILIDSKEPALINTAGYLIQQFAPVFKNEVQIVTTNSLYSLPNSSASSILTLGIDEEISGGKEAYHLEITESGVTLLGQTNSGVFMGVQTLKQLVNIHRASENNTTLIKTGTIRDYPRMEYRGFMLDTARFFYSVDEVKQIIDHLATYKYNFFHFHITDDQGWRIEIPSWPKLTTIGSNSAVGKETCENCFYSLDEYEEIVRYADSRHITLIPEIDTPGHVRAAMASYKDELYCDGDAPEWPYTGIEVKISSLCFSNPKIYEFFNDVVFEVAARTTGPYIHVGGDETPKWVDWEDYQTFMLRAQQIIHRHGKTMMGWTDDLGTVTGLGDKAIGQHWSITKTCCETTLNMAKQGSKIVLSPANKTYLDIKYDINAPIGLDWAGYNSIENSYNWNPNTIVPGLPTDQIYGIEAALWGEKITSINDAEYQMFPRLLTLSEVAWTPQEKRDWKAFSQRLKNQMPRLAQQRLNHRKLF